MKVDPLLSLIIAFLKHRDNDIIAPSLAWGFDGQHEVRVWNGACSLPMPREAWGGGPVVRQACEGGVDAVRSPGAGRGDSLSILLPASGSALLYTGQAALR